MGYPDPQAPPAYGGPPPGSYQQPPMQQGYGAPPPHGYGPTPGAFVVGTTSGQNPTVMRLGVAFLIALSGWVIGYGGAQLVGEEILFIGPVLNLLGIFVAIWALIVHKSSPMMMPNGALVYQQDDSCITVARIIGVIVLAIIAFYCCFALVVIIALTT